jgi:hypothetical protein
VAACAALTVAVFLISAFTRRILRSTVEIRQRSQSKTHSASVIVSGFDFWTGALRGWLKGAFTPFVPPFKMH